MQAKNPSYGTLNNLFLAINRLKGAGIISSPSWISSKIDRSKTKKPAFALSPDSLTATISQGSMKTDLLKIVAGGGITLKGKNVLYNGTIIGKSAGGTKGSALTITLNNTATNAAVTQLVRQIGYSNKSKKTPAGTRSIQFRVTDAAGHTSAPATKPVTLV